MSKEEDLKKLGIYDYVTKLRELHAKVPTPITKDTPNVDFHLFWSGPFSQWAISDFTVNLFGKNITFNCAEQFMMYMKASLFDDQEAIYGTFKNGEKIRDGLMDTISPRSQKAIGQSVRNYDDARWAAVRQDAVLVGTVAKYYCSKPHREALERISGKMAVEASPYDKIWGIGMREEDVGSRDPSKWKGTNLLGICVTEAGEILKYAYDEDFLNSLTK